MSARTFQDIIQTLNRYWAAQGCVLLQPLDTEVGAGTFHFPVDNLIPRRQAMDVQPCGIGRRRLLGGMGAAALAGAAPEQAWSQPAYPDKPIRLLMPLTPGGAADTNMRLMATKMTLGQPFVIDNRPGGSGSVAVQLAKNAPADGYTLLMTHPGMLSAQVLLKLYDLLDLFQPITMAGEGRLTLIVPSAVE